jgi:hypothetical protein
MNKIILKKVTAGGYTIEVNIMNNIILSISNTSGHKICLNDIVTSAGRTASSAPAGTKGRVVEILEPHQNGRSSNVIHVAYDNDQSEHAKFKDLQDINGIYAFHEKPEDHGIPSDKLIKNLERMLNELSKKGGGCESNVQICYVGNWRWGFFYDGDYSGPYAWELLLEKITGICS